jgi:hypothetical protein
LCCGREGWGGWPRRLVAGRPPGPASHLRREVGQGGVLHTGGRRVGRRAPVLRKVGAVSAASSGWLGRTGSLTQEGRVGRRGGRGRTGRLPKRTGSGGAGPGIRGIRGRRGSRPGGARGGGPPGPGVAPSRRGNRALTGGSVGPRPPRVPGGPGRGSVQQGGGGGGVGSVRWSRSPGAAGRCPSGPRVRSQERVWGRAGGRRAGGSRMGGFPDADAAVPPAPWARRVAAQGAGAWVRPVR